jgi:hypothetical protein
LESETNCPADSRKVLAGLPGTIISLERVLRIRLLAWLKMRPGVSLKRWDGLFTSSIASLLTHESHSHARLLKESQHMKAATIVGIILIILGIAGFAVAGISFTHEKKDVDLGPVQVSHEQKQTLPISPILSTLSLVAGVGLVVVGARAK